MNQNNIFQSHYAAFGETLTHICRRHHITHQMLRRASRLRNETITQIKRGK